jgi:hypothetical protein
LRFAALFEICSSVLFHKNYRSSKVQACSCSSGVSIHDAAHFEIWHPHVPPYPRAPRPPHGSSNEIGADGASSVSASLLVLTALQYINIRCPLQLTLHIRLGNIVENCTQKIRHLKIKNTQDKEKQDTLPCLTRSNTCAGLNSSVHAYYHTHAQTARISRNTHIIKHK